MYRRRGSTGGSSAGLRVASVTVTSGFAATWVFASDLAISADPGDGTGLQISGEDPTDFTGASPNSIVCNYASGTRAPGDPWAVVAQPPDVTTPLVVPQAGVTV